MRIVILSAPGAGKGTQASLLVDKLKIPHISTGDIFRANIRNNTALGKKAKEYIDKGLLVPDQITIEIVKDRIQQNDCSNGFLLDGFPRTIPQAEELDKALNGMGLKLDKVLNIHLDDDVIVERMSGRRVCPSCGSSYHIKYNPPGDKNSCSQCSDKVIQREDDKEETVLKRLQEYHEQTEPLIDFYRKQGILFTVFGQEKVEDTTREVYKALGI
jgi:adenylate kinase